MNKKRAGERVRRGMFMDDEAAARRSTPSLGSHHPAW
jgi:hypothetical protein